MRKSTTHTGKNLHPHKPLQDTEQSQVCRPTVESHAEVQILTLKVY